MLRTKAKGLTQAQISLYWKSFSAACEELGLRGRAERDNYRRAAMLEAVGKASLKDLNRTSDLDAVLSRFHADAGNYSVASDSGEQDVKRMAYLIKVICLQLMQIKGGDLSEARAYLGGILDQARLPNGHNLDDDGYWVDMSPKQAKAVFAMLDTHRRRLLRNWSSRSTFSPTIRYEVDGMVLTRQEVPKNYYATIPFRVNLRN
jgi:hypothetical protein